MVMKKNAMRKNLLQSILKSLGRYLAIVAIIALGASMFVGLLMTKSDMVATGQEYMDAQNMFDLRLVSTYGWAEEQLGAISRLEGVVDAEGVIYTSTLSSRNQCTAFSSPEGRICTAKGLNLADSFVTKTPVRSVPRTLS